MRILLLLSFFIFAALGYAQDQGYPDTSRLTGNVLIPKTHAIVIGVSEYSKLRPSKQLNYADDDAKLMVDYLESWDNIEINLFTDRNATDVRKIGTEITMALKNAEPGEKVILYFSGHGDISAQDEDGYLLLSNVDNPTDVEYAWSDAVSMAAIKKRALDAIERDVQVYMIFDACKSGFAEADAKESNVINKVDDGVLMLSSQDDEFSQELPELEHGVFTYYLVNGLRGNADKNDDQEITSEELRDYVIPNVSKQTNKKQNPVIQFPEYGMYVASFSKEDQQLAQEDVNSRINLALEGKSKGLDVIESNYSDRCEVLYDLFMDKTSSKVFFQEDMQGQQGNYFMGATERRIRGEQIIEYFETSKGGNYRGLIRGGNVELFGTEDLRHPYQLVADASVVNMTFSLDERMVVTSHENNELIVWETRTGDRIKTNQNFESNVVEMQFINDDELILSLESGEVLRWNIREEKASELKLKSNSPAKTMKVVSNNLYLLYSNDKIVVFDLEKNKMVDKIKGDFIDFEVLPTNNKIFAITPNEIQDWDLLTYTLSESYSSKEELIAIEVEPFEEYVLVGGEGGEVKIYGTRAIQEERKGFKAKKGVQHLDFNPMNNTLTIIDPEGNVTTNIFRVDFGMGALSLRDQLATCQAKGNTDRLDAELVLALNHEVTPLIRSLIKDENLSVSLEELQRAKKYAKEALKLGRDFVLDEYKLEINILLIEVFEILQSEDKSRYDEGIAMVEKMKKLDPRGAYPYNISGRLYEMLNDMVKAQENYEIAEEKAPNWISPKMRDGEISMTTKNYSRAEEKFKAVIKLDPTFSRAHANLIQTYLKQGEEGLAKLEEYKKEYGASVTELFPYLNTLEEKPNDKWNKYRKYRYASTGVLFSETCMNATGTECLSSILEQRGAYPIKNGRHKVVIAFFDDSRNSLSIDGEAVVEEDKVVQLFLVKKDGSLDELKGFGDKYKDKPAVVKGASITTYTAEGASFDIYFVDKIVGGTQNFELTTSFDPNDKAMVKSLEAKYANRLKTHEIGDQVNSGTIFSLEEDKKHGLIMADMETYPYVTHDEAKALLQALDLDGSKEWRLATPSELKTMFYSGVNVPVEVIWTEDEGASKAWYDLKYLESVPAMGNEKRFVVPVKAF